MAMEGRGRIERNAAFRHSERGNRRPESKKRAFYEEISIVLIFLTTASYSQDVSLRNPRLQLVHVSDVYGAKLIVYNPEEITKNTITANHFECTITPYEQEKVLLTELTGIMQWHAESVNYSVLQTSISFAIVYSDAGYLTCRLTYWMEINSNTILVRISSRSTVLYHGDRIPSHALESALEDYKNSTQGSIDIFSYVVTKDGQARVTFQISEVQQEEYWLERVQSLRDFLLTSKSLDAQYRSTRYCYAIEDGIYKWPKTALGKSSSAIPSCLLFNGSLARIRRCMGDFSVGAYWEELREERFECQKQTERMAVLERLRKAMDEEYSLEKLAGVITKGNETLNVVEVLSVAEALRNFSETIKSKTGPPPSYNISFLVDIVDTVLDSGPKVVRMANSSSGTSSTILTSVDQLIINATSPHSSSSFVSRERMAVFTVGADQNVKGFAAYGNWSSYNDVRMDALSETNWTSSISSNDTPNLAAILLSYPEKVTLTSTIYHDTSFFGNPDGGKRQKGSVVGLKYFKGDGANKRMVEGNITVLLLFPRGVDTMAKVPECAYWDLKSERWSLDGCAHVQSEIIPFNVYGCLCTHLTHFGMLISYHGPKKDVHGEKLTMITISGCSLSLFCLLLTFLYVTLVPQWRRNVYRKIELHLFASIALLDLTILIINASDKDTEKSPVIACVILGALMHYSVLATFTWMLVVAALQYLRLSPGTILDARRRAGTHLLLKASVFAWGVPVIPVVSTLGVGPDLYERRQNTSFCYPKDIVLYVGVAFPVALAVLLNTVVFSCILRTLFCSRSISSTRRENWKPEMIRRIFYSLFLFCLLGLSWIPGMFLQIGKTSDLWVTIFSYVFCATATLQGVSLFVFFVVCEKGSWSLLRKELSKHASRLSTRVVTSKNLPNSVLRKFHVAHDMSSSLPATTDLDNTTSSGRYITSSVQ